MTLVKRKSFWILGAVTAIWLGLMLFLSSQNGEDTLGLSEWICKKILSLFGRYNASDMARLNAVLRKAAHFFLFFVLGIMSVMWTVIIPRFSVAVKTLFCFAVCFIIAFFDEAHKVFIPGRHFSLFESLLNFFGAAAGIGAAILVCCVIRHIIGVSRRKVIVK